MTRVPARLRGAHPRGKDGRFITRSAAKGQITRLEHRRAVEQREARKTRVTREGGKAKRFRRRSEAGVREIDIGAGRHEQDIVTIEDWIEAYEVSDESGEDFEVETSPDYATEGE